MSRKRRPNRPANTRTRDDSSPKAVVGGEPFPYASAAVAGFLFVAVFLVFGQTIGHGFADYDDPTYIVNNRCLTDGTIGHRIVWAFTTNCVNNWHPLTWISHLLDVSVYGLEHPGGHHFGNVLLHAASAILLFLALRRLTDDFWPSAFAAAVFALHPLRVESVAWVAERKDVLSGLFFMLVLWSYAAYARLPFSLGRYLAVVGFFALGLLAKPTLVTLPFLLLLLDYWPLRRLPGATKGTEEVFAGRPRGDENALGENLLRPPGFPPRLLVEKIPLLVLAAGSCAATLWAQRISIDVYPVSLPYRIGNAAVACVAYLIQFFWPTDMAVLYPHPGTGLSWWAVAAATLVLAAISAAVVVLWRRCPPLLVGWLWYLGMLVPMIGLVQVGWQARADRYTYLPQIGLCIMVAWGMRQAAVPRIGRRATAYAAALALAVLVALAHQQTALWHNSETLWRHTLKCTDNNSIAYCHLGMALADQGHYDEAISEYQEGEKINPNSATIENNLGYALSKSGRLDEAIAAYSRAADIDPKMGRCHTNLGAVLQKKGRLEEAISQYEIALNIDAGNAIAHYKLAAALQQKKDVVAAISHYQKAIELQPDFREARVKLSAAIDQLHHDPAALVRWRDWIDVRPDDCVLLNDAAWLMATSGDASLRNGKDAVKLAGRAARLTRNREPTILATLAAAYAEAGRFSDAERTARQALAIALRQGNQPLVESIEAKLPAYKSRKPYHQ